jgi:preprotein translocase subunit SecG
MLTTLLQILHVLVCSILMFVVLLQQGRGGGMGAALGGGGAAQVFGGRGAGNILTRATAVAAMTFMLTSVSLAYLSSSGDRALRARAALEEQRHASKPAKAKDDKTSGEGATKTPAAPSSTPAEGTKTPSAPASPPSPAPAPSP